MINNQTIYVIEIYFSILLGLGSLATLTYMIIGISKRKDYNE